jgi:CheY-like chemotaxis protein
MKEGPIIIIEDDPDDKNILEDIIHDLDRVHKLLWFENGKNAFQFLRSSNEQPFLIFCDVNLPGISGIEFKKQVDADPELRKKSIPFIFYSTSVDSPTVTKAYTEMTVQGFFKKENSHDEIKKNIKIILDYWHTCRHPNKK